VMRLPLSGGPPVKVLDGVINAGWDLSSEGIYYVMRAAAGAAGVANKRQTFETRLQYYDFATKTTSVIARDLGQLALGLSVSRDGRTIFYSRVDAAIDELMIVENFR
jgi:hypothetical protein